MSSAFSVAVRRAEVNTKRPYALMLTFYHKPIASAFMIFALLGLTILTSLFQPVRAEEVSPQQIEQLKTNIAKIDRWLSKANSEKSGLSIQLKKQDQQIDLISRKIRTTKTKIAELEKQLSSLKKQRGEFKQALNRQKASLIKQLEALYFQGKQPALKILLDTNDPQNTARYLSYFAYINKARNNKIQTFQATLSQLKDTEKAILTQQADLNKSQSSLESSRSQLSDSRAKRQKVLTKLNQQIQNESQRLGKLKADHARLEKLLKEVEMAIVNIPLPADAKPFSQLKSKLPRPSHGKVVGRFGSRIAQGKLRLNGIHIETKEDDRVNAVHYGRVVFADWIRGFGLLTILDHGDGYMSLYGNNKSLLKETGDWVRSGETIAYSSKSSDKNESGLYFEIRKNGKPQNPERWLRK